MNKRRNQRIEVPDLVADVSDGINFFSGTLRDVSRYGILLDDIPQKFKKQATALSILISINGINFKKMKGIPRWVGGNSLKKRMGIHIPEATSSWIVFVKSFETKGNDHHDYSYP